MTIVIKRNKYLQAFQAMNHNHIKFQGPLILKMYGALNRINLRIFILAFNKAREYNLLKELYDEYIHSIKAISEKQEFKGSYIQF